MTTQEYIEELRLAQMHADDLEQWDQLDQQIKELEAQVKAG